MALKIEFDALWRIEREYVDIKTTIQFLWAYDKKEWQFCHPSKTHNLSVWVKADLVVMVFFWEYSGTKACDDINEVLEGWVMSLYDHISNTMSM
jgi:hypothetical protein